MTDNAITTVNAITGNHDNPPPFGTKIDVPACLNTVGIWVERRTHPTSGPPKVCVRYDFVCSTDTARHASGKVIPRIANAWWDPDRSLYLAQLDIYANTVYTCPYKQDWLIDMNVWIDIKPLDGPKIVGAEVFYYHLGSRQFRYSQIVDPPNVQRLTKTALKAGRVGMTWHMMD